MGDISKGNVHLKYMRVEWRRIVVMGCATRIWSIVCDCHHSRHSTTAAITIIGASRGGGNDMFIINVLKQITSKTFLFNP